MAKRQLEWRRAARADLLAILDYISDDNPDAAIRLVDEIEAKVSKLPHRPGLYRKVGFPAPWRWWCARTTTWSKPKTTRLLGSCGFCMRHNNGRYDGFDVSVER